MQVIWNNNRVRLSQPRYRPSTTLFCTRQNQLALVEQTMPSAIIDQRCTFSWIEWTWSIAIDPSHNMRKSNKHKLASQMHANCGEEHSRTFALILVAVTYSLWSIDKHEDRLIYMCGMRTVCPCIYVWRIGECQHAKRRCRSAAETRKAERRARCANRARAREVIFPSVYSLISDLLSHIIDGNYSRVFWESTARAGIGSIPIGYSHQFFCIFRIGF